MIELAAGESRTSRIRTREAGYLKRWRLRMGMRYMGILFVVFVVGASLMIPMPAHAGAKDYIRKNYQLLDPTNPEHAAIVQWHIAVLAGNYESWRKYATRAYIEQGWVSDEVFRKLRATMPKNILAASNLKCNT